MTRLEGFAERLNFQPHEWKKVESLIADVAPGFSEEGAALRALVDREALAEVAADDNDEVGASGRSDEVERSGRSDEVRSDEVEWSGKPPSERSGATVAGRRAVLRPTAKWPAAPPNPAPALPSGPPTPPPAPAVPPSQPPPPALDRRSRSRNRGVWQSRPRSRSVRRSYSWSVRPQGWCPQCHCMRADCFNPGDWACLHCGQHNYGDKSECSNFRCKRKRQELEFVSSCEEKAPQRAQSPWCISCKKLKTVCFRLNDWECPWCCNHNFARKQALRVRNRTYECHSYECHS